MTWNSLTSMFWGSQVLCCNCYGFATNGKTIVFFLQICEVPVHTYQKGTRDTRLELYESGIIESILIYRWCSKFSMLKHIQIKGVVESERTISSFRFPKSGSAFHLDSGQRQRFFRQGVVSKPRHFLTLSEVGRMKNRKEVAYILFHGFFGRHIQLVDFLPPDCN